MNEWVVQDFVRRSEAPAPRRSWRFILGAALSMILHGLLLLWLIDPVLRSQAPSSTTRRPELQVAWFELVDVPPQREPPEPKPSPAPAPEPKAAPPVAPTPATRAPALIATLAPDATSAEPERPADSNAAEASSPTPPALTGLGESGEVAPATHGQPEPADYVWDVLSHLEQFQSYPEPARRRGESGTVLIRARVSRHGVVLAATVLSSSGSKRLDQAALALLTAASPLPEPPPGETAITELELPIVYRLGPL
ncbi:hypothetical protein C7S18_00665 [Ahniella affigens]|uniref:TonB C-terminal domain-containing protein n=1 Tax=Ahniella affigens TaxID=2021234 RepID=A0A2P1PLT8_9GAMM|nr:TonB family protein [Ahniella affigens]AVP95799.1 hypothetical protein C7S18_00665 [Ahniella affigens]